MSEILTPVVLEKSICSCMQQEKLVKKLGLLEASRMKICERLSTGMKIRYFV